VLGGSFTIGGTTEVARLGYGAMQLTGPGIWGPPRDRDEAIRVLRRAVELGVGFIDTADSYGPFVSEELIREALHPYPDDLVIGTKGGLTRGGPDDWRVVGRPEYLRQQCELSLRHLGLERIELYQLHRIDPKVPVEETLGELVLLQQEGKLRHIGLSEVTVEEIERARKTAEIATVQNLFNVANRQSEDVLDYCEREGIGFIPWFPLNTGGLADAGGPLAAIAERHGASPAQLALSWLLHRSPVMLPIPGTSKVDHLEDNMKGAALELSEDEVAELEEAGAR
jgi:aryl-alcohol dehydrogenase-like predicted oxidoreductase